MEFTGERFVPGIAGDIAAEHYHRYAAAARLAAGADALDIACGEGYGCAELARVARSVVGVDIDPKTIAHAAAAYGGPTVRFLVGAADAIPLPAASVDLVTSFETLEHHARHDEMLAEIRRTLRPGGLLVLSSPNRPVYSATERNPFHVRELDRAELETLLLRHFAHFRLLGQRLLSASFLAPTEGPEALAWLGAADLLAAPRYFVALCSDDPAAVERAVGSVYPTADADLAHWSERVHAQMQAARDQCLEAVYARDDALRQLFDRTQERDGQALARENAERERDEARRDRDRLGAELSATQADLEALRRRIAPIARPYRALRRWLGRRP